jgi:hypothetical protein
MFEGAEARARLSGATDDSIYAEGGIYSAR